jgi:hypothetical protein
VCSNGWSAWVDGRLLVPVTASTSPPAEARPANTAEHAAPVADHGKQRPVIAARLQAALDEVRQLADQVAAGTLDMPTFQRRSFTAGLILFDDEAWFLDLHHGRWCRYDGIGVWTTEQLEDALGGTGGGEVSDES